MTQTETTGRGTKPVLRYILAAVALIFGAATIKAGGDVLFFQ
jgi:DNA-binding protein